ncbi:MAG: disulfide bond formation protein B [bacterium]|nr:disulfide bond formation protein B [bacterium]
MSNLFAQALPFTVLLSHIVLVIVFLSIVFRKSWGREVTHWVGKNAVSLGLLVAVVAVGGSLFYSNIIGFPPCVLCWWQRIALYPMIVLFAVAFFKKHDRGVFSYAVPLATFAGILALYHSYVYWGGTSILPCTALGGACSKIYVYAFGYITIPTMSLTIALFILLLAWSNKIYQSR